MMTVKHLQKVKILWINSSETIKMNKTIIRED
jgi:hypothetical protein